MIFFLSFLIKFYTLVSVGPSISWASLSTRKAPVTLPCGLSLTSSPERSDTLASEQAHQIPILFLLDAPTCQAGCLQLRSPDL